MGVGLMCAALHLDVLDLGRQDPTLVNSGADEAAVRSTRLRRVSGDAPPGTPGRG